MTYLFKLYYKRRAPCKVMYHIGHAYFDYQVDISVSVY